MNIDPDPKPDNIDDSEEDFDKHFAEFASGNKPDPNPDEDKGEAKAPGGNGPDDDKPNAPADEDNPDEGESKKAAVEGEEKADDATPGEAKEPHGEKPSGKQAPDDEWAGLPEELKAKVEQLRTEREEAIHRASSDANRVAALRRQLHQLQTGITGQAQPKSEEPTEAQKALEGKIKQLKEDYPEVATPLIELLEAQRKELTSVRTQLDGLTEAQQSQVIAAEAQALDAKHPDWRQIAQSPDFAGWLELQPANIQRLANSWDARETSVVLTLFKAEKMEANGGKPQESQQSKADGQEQQKPDAATGARRSQQLEGGRDVRSKPAPAASGPPEDFDAAFNYFVEKKRLASSR